MPQVTRRLRPDLYSTSQGRLRSGWQSKAQGQSLRRTLSKP